MKRRANKSIKPEKSFMIAPGEIFFKHRVYASLAQVKEGLQGIGPIKIPYRYTTITQALPTLFPVVAIVLLVGP